jgi:membrane-associated phospholipid phosphatase
LATIRSVIVAACALLFGIVTPVQAAAQDGPAPPKKDCNFVCDVGRDFKSFGTSRNTATVLGIGLGFSLLSRRFDQGVARSGINSELFDKPALDRLFEPGDVGGGTPAQLGLAVTTFTIAKIAKNQPAADLGAALVRAQLLTTAITAGLKMGVRRERPDQSSRRSFPSGHTSGTFATATILHRQFGWKAGVPAFMFSGLVATSRLNENKHYLSDVVFGAAIGIASGMSVTMERRDSVVQVRPRMAQGGMGLELSFRLP